VRTEAGTHAVDAVVVAAGAWSAELARQLGHRVPLDTERGYHVMLPDPGVMPRLPIYSGDHSFAVTPLAHGLRFAGTVELGGLDAPPNYARADVLLERGRRMFPGLRDSGMTQWMGFRPSMPDSVPVIAASPRHRNAFFAFGHGHLGLTLAAVTGRLVADLVAGRETGIDMAPFRVDRF
jgi:D-amino-acid dehydrogenase